MSQQLVSEEDILRQPSEAQAIIRKLLDKFAELEAKFAELEQRTKLSPRNSSRPPSSEHPHAKPTPEKTKSKKKRGGQRNYELFRLVSNGFLKNHEFAAELDISNGHASRRFEEWAATIQKSYGNLSEIVSGINLTDGLVHVKPSWN